MRINIIIALLVFSGLSLAAQNVGVRQRIVAASDSLRLRYSYYYRFTASVGDNLLYDVNKTNQYITFSFSVQRVGNITA